MGDPEHWIGCQTRLRYKYRKRTRTIFSSLEDHYLRGDISCGFEGCPHCTAPSTTGLTPNVPYICIPDPHALLDYQEVWEMQDLSNLVICTSVLQKFSVLANARRVAKLRALYRDPRRHVYLFDDLHCQWITSGREGDPSRLLPEVAQFYRDHLGNAMPVIVVSDRLSQQSEGRLACSPHLLSQQLQQLHLEGGPQTGQQQQQQQQQALVLQQGLCSLSPADFFGLFFKGGSNSGVFELFDSLLQAKLDKEQRAAAVASGDPQALAASQDLKPHWSQIQVEEGLIQGELLQGVLHVSLRNPREAVVQVGSTVANSALGRLVRVSGRLAMNRALHRDTVAVRLLPQAPSSPSLPQTTANGNGDVSMGEAQEDNDEQVDNAAQLMGGTEMAVDGEAAGDEEGAAAVLSSSDEMELLPLGEVVAVLQRSTHCVVGCLAQQEEEALQAKAAAGAISSTRQEAVLVAPYDRRLPFIRVRTRVADRLMGQRFVVRVDSWERVSWYPDGHMVRVIGPINDMRAESEAVLEHTGITWQPFCSGALAELPAVPGGDPSAWTVPIEEREQRRDLTGPEYFVASIDPVGCTDVDDALHVRALPDGRVEVGVHIADVSYFVRAGSMLDGEAKDRCTSVYLVDRRLDMLPSLLSEQLCSLRKGHERLAVSVIWTLESSTSFAVQDVWLGRSVIRSRHELHYQQAQDIADGKPSAPGDELPPQDRASMACSLDILIRLTASLHATRVANGALELSSSELRFQTDENGQPVAVKAKPKIPMMDVVAEMMIAANAAVAERIATAFPGAALLRNHPPPREEAFEQVKAVLEQGALGPSSKILANVDPSDNQSLSRALEDACRQASGKDAAVAQLLKSLTTRAMSEAKYFSTGAAAPGTAGSYHYGLALQYYTHFTSPIRRYADVVAHRQLLAAVQSPGCQASQDSQAMQIDTGQPPIPHADLLVMAERMNEQHRASKAAQKECMELYLLLLLHSKPHVESALLVGIQGRDQLDVFVPSIQMRGKVRMMDSRGTVKAPLTGSEGEEEGRMDESCPLHLSISEDKQHVSIVDASTASPVWAASALERIWLVLDADGSRAHGPRLRMRLAADTHPLVQAKQAEMAVAKEAQRTTVATTQPTPQTAAHPSAVVALPTPQHSTAHSTAQATTPSLALSLPPSISPAAQQMLALKGLAPPPPTPSPSVQQTVLHPPVSSPSVPPTVLQPPTPSPSITPTLLQPPLTAQQPQQQAMQQAPTVQQPRQQAETEPDVADVMQGGPSPDVLHSCCHMPLLPANGSCSGLSPSASLLRRCQAVLAKYEARIAKASLKRAERHRRELGKKLLAMQTFVMDRSES